MKLTYYGHSAFLLEAGNASILIDPFDPGVGYPMPDVSPDAVVISHEHSDHNHAQAAKGSPKVIRGLRDGGKDWADVNETVGPVKISTVRTFHDGSEGSQRGRNAMLIFEADGLRLVHCGDLGHTLSPEQVKALGKIDALLIPIGGHYTIGPAEADTVIGQLRPRVVIPMHYKTAANKDWPTAFKDGFLAGKARVRQQAPSVTLTPGALPADPEIWVLSA